jgi:hypothetical protein
MRLSTFSALRRDLEQVLQCDNEGSVCRSDLKYAADDVYFPFVTPLSLSLQSLIQMS